MKDQAHQLKQIDFNEEGEVTIYTVVSGKGGVGKSNLSLNLALAMNEAGKKVLLIDGDVGMANLDILSGLPSFNSLSDYFEKDMAIAEILVEVAPGLDLLPGGSGLMGLQTQSQYQLQDFLEELLAYGQYDAIVIDAGAGVSSRLLSFVLLCDELILVTIPEPTAVADAYSLAKVLSSHKIKEDIQVVINQVDSMKEAQETFERLDKVAGAFLQLKLVFLGAIHADNKVRKAVSMQKPYLQSYPRSQPSQDIRAIQEKLDHKEKEAVRLRPFGQVISRFFRMFS